MKHQANSPIVERGIKRVASDELGSEVKKITVDHHSHQKQAPSIVSPSLDQPKFMSATMMMNSSARANVQIMPELSDEELLAYAVEFEKNNP